MHSTHRKGHTQNLACVQIFIEIFLPGVPNMYLALKFHLRAVNILMTRMLVLPDSRELYN